MNNASRFVVSCAVALGFSACAGTPATTSSAAPQQSVDPAIAQQLVDATAPRQTFQANFGWAYKDESMHFSGRGAARVAPPYRARTDLFGPRGETLLRSVTIGDKISIPANLPQDLLPPVALGWATMGVLRAPEGSTLELTRASGDTVTIGYARAQEHWRFRFIAGRMQYAEWQGPNASKRTVELKGSTRLGLPQMANYRDWAAFRDLTITVEEVNEAVAFPPETWILEGQ